MIIKSSYGRETSKKVVIWRLSGCFWDDIKVVIRRLIQMTSFGRLWGVRFWHQFDNPKVVHLTTLFFEWKPLLYPCVTLCKSYKTLWPSDATWLHRTRSILVQVMACWSGGIYPKAISREMLKVLPRLPSWRPVYQVTAVHLTHWGRDQMADIFQTTFSYAFSWMKIYEFCSRFHWSLFRMFQLTIPQHWFRY